MASSWWQVILIVVLPLFAGATLAFTAALTRSLSRLRLSADAQTAASRELARATMSQQLQAKRREPVLVPDYVDRDLLEDIARQKGLQVDRVQWEVGESETETEETASEVGMALGAPGASLSSKLAAREARGHGRHRARTSDRLYDTRSLLGEVVEALDRDGELRRDLAYVPDAAQFEALFLQQLMYVWGEWELDGVPDEDPRKELDRAVDSLANETIQRLTAAKEAELEAAIPGRGEAKFALIETEWKVTVNDDGTQLRNEWLVEADEDDRVETSALVPDLIVVPIDPGKLVGMGEQRVKEGPSRWWRVFGKIEMYEDGALLVLPIVIASL
jgi:hypothetical protein